MAKEITIETKYVLAAYDVPKSMKKELAGRRILQGVHVDVDKAGKWRVESCDSFKVARITDGYVGGKDADYSFTVPPETLAEFKATDKFLTFQPDLDKMTCKVVRVGRNGVQEWEFSLIEGNWPNTEQLWPSDVRSACYRYSANVDADYLGCLMGVVRKALGKSAIVELATQENGRNKPVVGIAEGAVRVEMLLMPCRADKSFFGKEAPRGEDAEELARARKELEAVKANAEMWKAKALEAGKEPDGRAAELEAEVEQLRKKADRWVARAREEKAKRVELEGDGKLQDKAKELEAELKAARKELEEVWKENASLKAKAAPVSPKPTEKVAEAAAEVSLAIMQEWCEGKGLIATQKREGACIWVEGESKPYAGELKGMGFRFAKKRKSWYINTAA